jgi:hypothetical protein
MKSLLGISVIAAVALASSAALASNNPLYIDSNDALNSVAIGFIGDANSLTIEQDFTGTGGGNKVTGAITGDRNGLVGSSFSAPLALATGLVPGKISQSGHDNMISVQVAGNQNLFAMSQTGSFNTLTASMIGNNNQAAILQVGTGNYASFSQNGNGNMLSIVQRN